MKHIAHLRMSPGPLAPPDTHQHGQSRLSQVRGVEQSIASVGCLRPRKLVL